MAGIDTSIVVPAYNVEAFLERFFESVLRQSYQGFRLVFIDDASTDATDAYAQGLGSLLGERFIFLQNEKRMGLSGARNRGLDWVAQHPTEYLSFLDADDWMEDTYLEDLHTRAEETAVGLCVAGVVRSDATTGRTLVTEMHRMPRQVFQDAAACRELAFINPCSYAKLFRFRAVRDMRFRPILRSEDTCYLFDTLPRLRSLAFTNNALYHYCVQEESLSSAVNEEVYASMHEQFASMMPLFECEPYAAYRDLFETQVFIRSSIGGVMRLSENSVKGLNTLAREERDWLDATMPSWRTNPYLSKTGRRLSRTGRLLSRQAALSFAATLYKQGLFSYLVYAYRLYQRVFKREVRV